MRDKAIMMRLSLYCTGCAICFKGYSRTCCGTMVQAIQKKFFVVNVKSLDSFRKKYFSDWSHIKLNMMPSRGKKKLDRHAENFANFGILEFLSNKCSKAKNYAGNA